jgi:D-xylose transport system permease protein
MSGPTEKPPGADEPSPPDDRTPVPITSAIPGTVGLPTAVPGKAPAGTGLPTPGPAEEAEAETLSGLVGVMRRRIRQGEIGQLPVIVGIVLIWVIFYLQNSRFLSSGNLTNLVLQATSTGLISIGIVLVLLLGEIDLSVGAVSGLCAAIMAVLNVKHGVPAPLAILAGLAAGAAIGLFQGIWITRFRIPSFVVTLAGFLGWNGALLYVLGSTGTVNLTAPGITKLAGEFFSGIVGWIVAIVLVAIYVGAQFIARRRRVASGLPAGPRLLLIIRIVLITVALFATVAVVNGDRGLPLAMVIFIGFILVFDFITRRTTFGRHIFAVGGNAEAARRAGINVDRVRVIVFMLASTMAAAGGILAASRLLAVNQSSGGGDLLLNSIAAAVIGGTSLFGGRGSVWAALLGGLVIFSISNGMDLLALSSSVKFMVTGAVLLAAVTVDATARRGREAAGRA